MLWVKVHLQMKPCSHLQFYDIKPEREYKCQFKCTEAKLYCSFPQKRYSDIQSTLSVGAETFSSHLTRPAVFLLSCSYFLSFFSFQNRCWQVLSNTGETSVSSVSLTIVHFLFNCQSFHFHTKACVACKSAHSDPRSILRCDVDCVYLRHVKINNIVWKVKNNVLDQNVHLVDKAHQPSTPLLTHSSTYPIRLSRDTLQAAWLHCSALRIRGSSWRAYPNHESLLGEQVHSLPWHHSGGGGS